MLPGIGGRGGRIVRGPSVTVFYTNTNGNITAPAVDVARITAIGAGGLGGDWENNGNYDRTGGGGALAQSVVSIIPGETLQVIAGSGSSIVKRSDSRVIVDAGSGTGYGAGGTANTGQVLYNGANGANGKGGGAAGTLGAANGQSRGPGMSFTQTSDGATATNGNGGNTNNQGGLYGGGGGASTSVGRSLLYGAGIVIIEWGFGQ